MVRIEGIWYSVPSRWAHWLDHPTDEVTVSFEMGFWTHETLRARKVHDVNWLLRRGHVPVRAPGEGLDWAKCRLAMGFDFVTLGTDAGFMMRAVTADLDAVRGG